MSAIGGSESPSGSDLHKEWLRAFLIHLPTTSLVASAVIYTTGFLTIFAFHDTYRLRGVDVEIFKVKYFHVGIMFMALLGSVVFPFGALLAQKRYAKDPVGKWQIDWTAITAFAWMTLNFLVVLFFVPRGLARHSNVQISLLVTIGAPVVLGRFYKKLRDAKREIVHRYRTAIWLNVLLVGCLLWIISPFWRSLVSMIWPAAIWFIVFALFITFVLASLVSLGDEPRPAREQQFRIGCCIAMLSILYFSEINIFAAGIYHYIPAAKAGGDYALGRVVLRVAGDSVSVIPPNLVADRPTGMIVTKPLVLIEATPSTIYLADPTERGGPAMWRRGFADRPAVIEINRTANLTLEYCKE